MNKHLSEKVYVEFDEDMRAFFVYGENTGFAYASFKNERSAMKHAKSLNRGGNLNSALGPFEA